MIYHICNVTFKKQSLTATFLGIIRGFTAGARSVSQIGYIVDTIVRFKKRMCNIIHISRYWLAVTLLLFTLLPRSKPKLSPLSVDRFTQNRDKLRPIHKGYLSPKITWAD